MINPNAARYDPALSITDPMFFFPPDLSVMHSFLIDLGLVANEFKDIAASYFH